MAETAVCKHCGKPIESAHRVHPALPAWRHAEDHLFTCFNEYLERIGTYAEPQEAA